MTPDTDERHCSLVQDERRDNDVMCTWEDFKSGLK